MSKNQAGSDQPDVDLARFGVRDVAPRARDAARIAVIGAQFNHGIVDRLIEGALAALEDHGVAPDSITLVRVPGAWELPQAARAIAHGGRADAIVALGCVIRGETSHYDVIVNESARGLMQVACDSGIPVSNGVLACENEAQALARAGGAEGNKGAEAALAALEMASLCAWASA
jgi:6,7-dimethyl-8-ribityllumazine synthase